MKGRRKWTRNSFLALTGLVVGAPFVAYTTHGQDAIVVIEFANIDTEADRILREMSEYLVSQKEFSFRADVLFDVMLSHGQVVQLGGTSELTLRRPGQARAFYNGDERRTRTYLDNGKFTMHNATTDVYAVTELPAEIDAALDFIFYRLGFSVPFADLLYADPYAVLIENVQTGFVVGDHPVAGRPCKHLAFSQDSIDWEIWISSVGNPVPMKLVIRYKSEQGSPQYTANLSDWNFHPLFSAIHFEFHPPAGADLIEFLPSAELEEVIEIETEMEPQS